VVVALVAGSVRGVVANAGEDLLALHMEGGAAIACPRTGRAAERMPIGLGSDFRE